AETHAIDLIASASESLSLTYAGLGYHEEGLMAMRLAAESIRRSIAQPSATLATVLAAQARFALLCNDRTQALKILRQAQTLLAVDGGGAATDAARAKVLLQLGHCLAHQDYTAA